MTLFDIVVPRSHPKGSIIRALVAVLIVLVAAGIRAAFLSGLGTRVPFLSFYPAVALAALLGGFWPGVLAAVLSAAFADYVWMAPVGSFHVTDPLDSLSLGIFGVSSMMIAAVAEQAGQANKRLHDVEQAWRIGLEAQIKHRTDELLRTHEGIAIAADAARLGFWDYDVDTRTVQWDSWMYRLYGREPMEGRQPVDLWLRSVHEDDRPILQAMLSDAAGERADLETDLRAITPDGEERFLRVAGRIARDGDGAAREMNGVNFDITELKRAEQRLSLERDNATAANRAKSSFLAMMSHEVRTPMNGVMGMNALLCETSLSPRQRQLAEGVRRSADMLLRIIDDILDVSKLEAGKFDLEEIPFDLTQLLRETMQALQPAADEKGLELVTAFSSLGDGGFVGDPTRLRQIVSNLVSNAVKFTERGSVTIRVHGDRTSERRTRLRFEVSDTGIGVAPEARERLFRPFEQMDATISRRFGGTGLGLSICKSLVELMGGRIGVGDRPDGGSLFWFEVSLPTVQGPLIATLQAGETAFSHAAPAGHILLAEDNRLNVQLAQLILEPIGYTIDVAVNGRLAVEAAARGAYDLILMDIHMPELDGLAATREIRKRASAGHVPIVAITANASREDRVRCLEAGMDDFLAKPFEPRALLEVAARWVKGEAPAGELPRAGRTADPVPPIIDNVALDSLRAIMPGDRFDWFLEQCIDQMPIRISQLERQPAGADRIAGLAHELVGSAGVIGARRIEVLARRLEAAAENGDRAAVEDLTGRLDPAWTAVLAALAPIRVRGAAAASPRRRDVV